MSDHKSFRASLTFIWRQCDTIGTGAFGNVYLGHHKRTGECVAIKAFNGSTRFTQMARDQMKREVDILRELNHPNIVKLIAVEELLSEKMSRSVASPVDLTRTVMILEYATEGSLYAIIEQPEFNYGLPDHQFLRVLDHLTKALKYLRDEHKIIHRDVKPNNILKTITDKGEVFYKLCDFGAARYLEEDDSFRSVVGTEEYLHPEIYQGAFNRAGGAPREYSATSDLWSVATTLYHVATSQLPFRPYEGTRSNRKRMQEILANRPPEAIAGQETEPNGGIRWSSQLPDFCRLTSGLRPIICRLLKALMTTDPARKWTFDRFFTEVERVVGRAPLHWMDVASARFGTSYETDTFTELKQDICAQLQMSSPAFRFVWDGKAVEDSARLNALKPLANKRRPLLLLRQPTEPHSVATNQLPETPVFDGPQEDELNTSVLAAKRCSTVAHHVLREVEEHNQKRKVLYSGVSSFKRELWDRLKYLESSLKFLQQCWSEVREQIRIAKNCSQLSEETVQMLQQKVKSAEQVSGDFASLESDILNVKRLLSQLQIEERQQAIDHLSLEPHSGILMDDSDENDANAVKQTIAQLQEISTQFKKDKAMRFEPLTNEARWHEMRKTEMRNHWEKLKKLRQGTSFEKLCADYALVTPQFNSLVTTQTGLTRAESALIDLQRMLQEFSGSLRKLSEVHTDQDHDQNGHKSVNASGIIHDSHSQSHAYIADFVVSIASESQKLRELMQKNNEYLQTAFQTVSDTNE